MYTPTSKIPLCAAYMQRHCTVLVAIITGWLGLPFNFNFLDFEGTSLSSNHPHCASRYPLRWTANSSYKNSNTFVLQSDYHTMSATDKAYPSTFSWQRSSHSPTTWPSRRHPPVLPSSPVETQWQTEYIVCCQEYSFPSGDHLTGTKCHPPFWIWSETPAVSESPIPTNPYNTRVRIIYYICVHGQNIYPAWDILPNTALFIFEATAWTTSDILTWPAS